MKRLQELVDNKNILFIGPVYFGYEKEIIEELKRCGARVDFIQENVDATTIKFLLLNKFPESIREKETEKYFIKQINSLRAERYDFVFCLKIDLFTDSVMKTLKSRYPDAKYVLHYWDSCKRMRGAHDRASYFEKVTTFDAVDANAYSDEGWKLRPLFFIPSFREINKNRDKQYDVIYIATLSRERAAWYKKLKKYCDEHQISLYAKFYIRKFVWKLQKNKFEEYQGLPSEVISFTSIPMGEIQDKMAHSKVMFDCSHSMQSGLTMRSIECVGACERMATTNMGIREYDFFNDRNFFLLKETDDALDGFDTFVKEGVYCDLDPDVYEKYSLNYWLWEILV